PAATFSVELRLRHADGSWRTQEATVTNLLDHPAIHGIVVNSRDITESRRSEEAFRESEGRYRSLFEHMLNGFAYCKMEFDQGRPQDFRYLEVNDAFETLTGLKQVVGKKVSEVIPGIQASDPELFASYGRVALTGQPETLEIYVASLAIWFSIAIYSPQKEYFVAVFEVITERKRAEEALRASEIRFRALIEKSSEAVLLVGADGIVIYDSPSAERVTGYAAAEHANRRMFDQVHPDDRGMVTQLFMQLLQQPSETVITQLRIWHKEGSWHWIEGVATNLLDEPSVGAIVINYRDVTERKRTEEELARYRDHLEQLVAQRTAELQAAKDRAEAILDNSTDGILLVNSNLQIHQTNSAFNRLFACARDDYFNQALTSLALTEDVHLVTSVVQTGVVEGRARTIELRARRKDDTVFDAELSLGSIKGDGLVCTVRDITARKQAEDKLQSALEQQKELVDLKSRFISMASHDFRNPMSVILSSISLLEMQISRQFGAEQLEPLQKRLHRIDESVQQMTSLLDDVLTVNRADGGKVEIHPELLEVEGFCREILEEIEETASVRHVLNFSFAGEANRILADKLLWRQILINLLSNAVKYSPEGGNVGLDVRCEPENVEFRVQDNGIGIPEADQSRLFETFHRAHNVGEIKGTGLGMAIVKRAVDALKGTIIFESQVGVGTTFTVHLPTAAKTDGSSS
ncbi:MAG: PAS domain S-box protein, partial [Chloroflexota bacterium]